MKRRWWIVLGGAGFAAIGLIVGLSVFFGDPINRENFEKIQPGMTEADVVRILGRPPGNEATSFEFDEVTIDQAGKGVVKTRMLVQKTWQGSRTNISVAFNEDGTVYRNLARFVEADTIFNKIRLWLGLDSPPEWEEPFLTPGSTTETIPD